MASTEYERDKYLGRIHGKNQFTLVGDTLNAPNVNSTSVTASGYSGGSFTGTTVSGTIAQFTAVTASNAYISNNLTVEDYIQLLPVNDTAIPTNQTASYIYTSGSTNDLYFTQYYPGTSYTNTTRLRWLESGLESGLLKGGRLSTVNGTTTFNVASGSGIVVNMNASSTADPYPTIQYVQWSNFTSQSLPLIGTTQITYIAIDSSGSLVKSSTPFSDGDFTNYIVLGRILHQTGSVTNGAATVPAVAYGSIQNKTDFFRAFGPLKLSGHTLAASGSTLGLTKTSGTSFAFGRNYTVDPNTPNYISATTDTALTTSKIYREYVSGSTLVLDTGIANAGYTTIDPAKRLDTATGLLTSVPAGKYTTQRVFWFPNSINKALHIYYGNTQYNSLDEAQLGATTDNFIEDRYTSTEAIFVAYICVKANATDLTNTADARIIQAGFARGIGGPGGGGSSGGGGSPTGPAGGDLTGTYPDPTIASLAVTPSKTDLTQTWNFTGALQSGSQAVVVTTDSRLSDSRTPNGSAGGDLTGTYPNPTLASITTSGTSGSATTVPVITIDAKGRVTTLTSAAIAITTASVSGLGTAAGLNYDTDSTLAANSDSRIATQKATKTYADTKLSLTGGTLTGDLSISNDKSILMTEGSFYNLTRAMPTATGSTVDIGTISNTNFAANCELWYNVHNSGFAQSKRYFFPLSYNATNGAWQKLFPISSTGQYSGEDADVEINVSNLTGSLRVRRSSYFAYPSGTIDLVLFINGSSTTFTPSTATTTGAVAPTAIYPVKAEGFLTDYLGSGLSSVPATNRSLIMANTMVTDAGSYTLNSWNSTGVKVPVYSSCPSTNGGSTPVVSQPALVLARQGIAGQAYGNFAEFKVRRFEASGVAARTGLDIALTHGNGDASGTNIMSLTSNGNVGIGTLTPSASLHLKAGTTTAATAPLKFTSGSLLTSPEDGAVEFNGNNLYLTITSSTARKNITLDDGLTFGQIPFVTGSGRLAGSSALTYTASNSTLNMTFDQNAKTNMVVTNNSSLSSAEAGYSAITNAGTMFFGCAANASSTFGGEIYTAAAMPIRISTNNTQRITIRGTDGEVGIGVTAATAVLHLKAGTSTAGTSPLKFTSGPLMSTAEAGSVEFLTDKYYGSITTGPARKEFTLNDSALTSGLPVYATTNGRLTTTATGGSVVSVTSSTAPVTASSTGGHLRIVGAAAAKSVAIPTGSGVTVGTIFTIKDAAGNASGGTITVNATGTDTIDGATSQTITTNYGVLRIIYGAAGRFELI